MNTAQVLSRYESVENSEYMPQEMLTYFKHKLQTMRDQLLTKEESISLSLIDEPIRLPDPVDQGTNEELHYEDFQVQEHEDYLRHEIESALQRIHEGTYGYCEETDNPIGIKRLMAVPYARYSIKVQVSKEEERKRRMAFG